MVSNQGRDALFTRGWVKQLADGYLAGADPREPHASPVHADLTGLGPIYLQVGDDAIARLAGWARSKLRLADAPRPATSTVYTDRGPHEVLIRAA